MSEPTGAGGPKWVDLFGIDPTYSLEEEPTADARALARTIRDTYVALTLEGFSPTEAIALLGQMFAAATNPGTE